MSEIEQFREKIRGIDQQLIELLRQRFALARQLGVLKKQNGIDTYQPHIEAEHLKCVEASVSQDPPLDQHFILNLFASVIEYARRIQLP